MAQVKSGKGAPRAQSDAALGPRPMFFFYYYYYLSVQKYKITDLPNIQENKHNYNNKIVHNARLQKKKKRKTCENKSE